MCKRTLFQAEPRWVWPVCLHKSAESIFLGVGKGAASLPVSRTQYVYEADSAAFSAETAAAAAPASILTD